jgi:hypothetical protein
MRHRPRLRLDHRILELLPRSLEELAGRKQRRPARRRHQPPTRHLPPQLLAQFGHAGARGALRTPAHLQQSLPGFLVPGDS